jgi:RHS repeat-associated protein
MTLCCTRDGCAHDSVGERHSYTYDAENRIISVDGTSTTYTYDADGRRIKKSGGTNYWFGPGGETLAESDSSGVFTDYIFFGGQRLARNVGGDIKYYVTDHLHSTAVFADKSGTVLDDNDFYPWGGVITGIGQTTSTNHYKFTGKERDAESGLDDFGARYYSNVMGRFMSPDWAAKPTTVPYSELDDPQSLNLYSYVRNSPIIRLDADGHTVFVLDDGNPGFNDGPSVQHFGPADNELLDNQSSSGSGSHPATAGDSPQAQQTKTQQQNTITASAKGSSVTYTYPDGSKVVLKGTHPFRDNNPGDLRSGHGSIGRDGGFAIYPSLDAGVNALGATLTGKYADSTIADTMKAFAPAADGNDPVKYANTLATAVGVPVTTKISALSSAQLMTFQYNIANAEGYNAAGNTARYIAPPQQ